MVASEIHSHQARVARQLQGMQASSLAFPFDKYRLYLHLCQVETFTPLALLWQMASTISNECDNTGGVSFADFSQQGG